MVAGSKLSSVMTNLISKIKSTCRTCYKSDLFGTWLSIFGVETALGRFTSDLRPDNYTLCYDRIWIKILHSKYEPSFVRLGSKRRKELVVLEAKLATNCGGNPPYLLPE